MAEKTFNARFKMLTGLFADWTAKNPVLLEGEVAVVTIPAATGTVSQEPAVILKVGDGVTAFNDLPFMSAKAADVHDWAKAATKPIYNASEVTGIDAYIAEYVETEMGISVDTDTQYSIVAVEGDAYRYKLMSKSKGDSAFATEVSEIVIPKYDDTALAGRVTSAEGKIAALEGLVGSTAVSTQIANAIAAAAEDAQSKADAVDAKLTAEVERATAAEEANAAAAKAADDKAVAAQADVDALEAKVGTVPEGKTVAQMISDAQTAATYDDEEVRGLIQDNADAIDVLNGSGEGSVAKKITDAFNEFAANVTDDGVVNSFKELVDWAAAHGSDAAEMASAIQALEAIVDGIGGEGESATVVAYVNAAIAALNIGDYAKASDLSAAVDRIAALEAIDHEAYKEYADQAEADAVASAKAYADGLKASVDAEVAKKANDADLAAIAKTGNVADLIQSEGDVIIFDCGSVADL